MVKSVWKSTLYVNDTTTPVALGSVGGWTSVPGLPDYEILTYEVMNLACFIYSIFLHPGIEIINHKFFFMRKFCDSLISHHFVPTFEIVPVFNAWLSSTE